MKMSDMARRVTDAIRRMTDRLTHGTGTHGHQSSAKSNVSDKQ